MQDSRSGRRAQNILPLIVSDVYAPCEQRAGDRSYRQRPTDICIVMGMDRRYVSSSANCALFVLHNSFSGPRNAVCCSCGPAKRFVVGVFAGNFGLCPRFAEEYHDCDAQIETLILLLPCKPRFTDTGWSCPPAGWLLPSFKALLKPHRETSTRPTRIYARSQRGNPFRSLGTLRRLIRAHISVYILLLSIIDLSPELADRRPTWA